MKHLFASLVASSLALGAYSSDARAAATFLEPTAYLSFADSPFSGGSFGAFYLETFEDHLLNTPGVSSSPGGVTSVVFGPFIHDSVDADDGLIDGSGLQGDSYFSGSGSGGVTFTFSAAALGSLPTSVGIVWTDADGGSSVTFSAFGPGGSGDLLFTQTRSGFVDFSNNGETAEDRFFGVVNAAGISAIFVSNTFGGIEVDHLQYGLAVPEPQSYVLMLAGLAAGFVAARRQRG